MNLSRSLAILVTLLVNCKLIRTFNVANYFFVLGRMHDTGTTHGDLTTSNILLNNKEELVLIDFGLGGGEGSVEDKAVDIYVLERALTATHPNMEPFISDIVDAYLKVLLVVLELTLVSYWANIFRTHPKELKWSRSWRRSDYEEERGAWLGKELKMFDAIKLRLLLSYEPSFYFAQFEHTKEANLISHY
jgi:serine/threonine protein kinase